MVEIAAGAGKRADDGLGGGGALSDLEKKFAAAEARLEAKLAKEIIKVKRSLATRLGRGVAWTVGGLVTLRGGVVSGVRVVSRATDDFDRRVGKEVVKIWRMQPGGGWSWPRLASTCGISRLRPMGW